MIRDPTWDESNGRQGKYCMETLFPRPAATSRHKVFVSYHHANDQFYKDRFERLFTQINDTLVSRSVGMGDIDPYLNTETIRRIIRDDHLRDSTVTVVLVGSQTWQRKHVDWEIGSSIRDTLYNPRSGLLGIILPTYRMVSETTFDPYTIPPRLYDNFKCGFAKLYPWTENPDEVGRWIHDAYLRRNQDPPPDNSFPGFVNNRPGERWQP
jgi:MTH538 TIR-like domain (DUF1863)